MKSFLLFNRKEVRNHLIMARAIFFCIHLSANRSEGELALKLMFDAIQRKAGELMIARVTNPAGRRLTLPRLCVEFEPLSVELCERLCADYFCALLESVRAC